MGRVLKCLLFVVCATTAHTALPTGVILHEEHSIGEREPVRMQAQPFSTSAASALQKSPQRLNQSAHRTPCELGMVTPQLPLRWHDGLSTMPGAAKWDALIQRASREHGLAPALVAAVIKVKEALSKSGFRSL